jgi:hypothetical protein
MSLPNEEGIYLYRKGRWNRIFLEGPYVPEVDGIYLLYFRNFKCPGCKAFDNIWLKFINECSSISNYLIVQCNNFSFECKDVAASDSFIFYLVLETPQVIVVVVENNIPIYIEREVGVLTLNSLRNFALNVKKRMNVMPEEEGRSLEEEESIYIDFTNKNWKEITEKLKKILFEGRIPKEICTESGCKVIIE